MARHVTLLGGTVHADSSNEPSRQFCFTVSSPDGSFELQADNAVEQAEWMAALQVTIMLLMLLLLLLLRLLLVAMQSGSTGAAAMDQI